MGKRFPLDFFLIPIHFLIISFLVSGTQTQPRTPFKNNPMIIQCSFDTSQRIVIPNSVSFSSDRPANISILVINVAGKSLDCRHSAKIRRLSSCVVEPREQKTLIVVVSYFLKRYTNGSFRLRLSRNLFWWLGLKVADKTVEISQVYTLKKLEVWKCHYSPPPMAH